MRGLSVLSAALAVVVLVTPPSASAQERSNDWLARCRDDRGWSDQERWCEVRESGAKPSGRTIEIDGGSNGGALVRGWDRDSIAISARIQTGADTQDEARDIARAIRIVSDGGTIRAEGPSVSRHQWWSVTFDVMVPRRSDLRIDANNGPIGVEDVGGRMDLRTVNGPLSLTDVSGDVRGHTENGPLRVALEGSKWDGAGLDAETVNGPVVLTIPRNYSAHLETGTVNGPMSIGFPITVQGRITHRLSTDLGSGGPPVRAVTTIGPVTIGSR
jgi:hypothetical protein